LQSRIKITQATLPGSEFSQKAKEVGEYSVKNSGIDSGIRVNVPRNSAVNYLSLFRGLPDELISLILQNIHEQDWSIAGNIFAGNFIALTGFMNSKSSAGQVFL
jgi:hypothetical protein